MKVPKSKKSPTELIDQQIRRRTFVSFAAFAGLGSLAYGGWWWLRNSPKEPGGITAGAKAPFRKAFNKSELAFRRIFSDGHLAKTYPKSMAAKKVRQNGKIGLTPEMDNESWSLSVQRASGQVLQISLDELKSLPKTDIVFDFKCVEGWDQIQHWG
ncbi:molybdopterin-dependent oxidoreductase, partial [Daejeonella sp.]|uniref:molybdopterin-dependent oxidoreductase n=1 Tax=Daejeonella sp. TaxID=2805397 RepID=UPI0030BC6B26